MCRNVFVVSLLLTATVPLSVWGLEAGQRFSYPPEMPGAEVQTYKQVGDIELKIYIYKPRDWKAEDRRGAIVFFFGGGWQSGSPAQFRSQCEYLASRGMVAMAADYRVASRHNAKVVDCVADAKSAIRWVRKNAEKLGIDANKIAAGGGSAGGHLAACTAVIASGDDPSEDQSISSQANAAVLFNPALILSSTGIKDRLPLSAADETSLMERLRERIGADPKTVSPYHHIRPGLPPIIIFHGTADTTVPFATVKLFAEAMTKAGNQCRLVPFEGAGHGFFNFGRGDKTAYKETLRLTDEFLTELGYLTGKPTLE